ncbi:MAG: hypothetical protein MRJ65_10220 [Candidatus Brocadiaceae bacterium]|nr:hypothetical protein [Candidatus Brocadiaceae bacterium]
MNNYTNFLAMISTEFHKYLMENEEVAGKIPANALIIFQIKGEDDFNQWHKKTSLRNKEPVQPVVYISVKKWRRHSTIEEVNLSCAE